MSLECAYGWPLFLFLSHFRCRSQFGDGLLRNGVDSLAKIFGSGIER